MLSLKSYITFWVQIIEHFDDHIHINFLDTFQKNSIPRVTLEKKIAQNSFAIMSEMYFETLLGQKLFSKLKR